jgi:hypothetical protein
MDTVHQQDTDHQQDTVHQADTDYQSDTDYRSDTVHQADTLPQQDTGTSFAAAGSQMDTPEAKRQYHYSIPAEDFVSVSGPAHRLPDLQVAHEQRFAAIPQRNFEHTHRKHHFPADTLPVVPQRASHPEEASAKEATAVEL